MQARAWTEQLIRSEQGYLWFPLHPNIDALRASRVRSPQPEVPRHMRNQQSRLRNRGLGQVRFSGSFFFWGGAGGGRESIPAAKLGGGSWKSLLSPAGWRGEAVRSRAASAVGDRARCQLFASPLPLSFCELRRGYHSPAWGCRAFKEMFLFMQRCQISYASWHGVTAFMPPCLSLLTPISFYHCAAPWSFSAGFMFQPDCV